LSPTGALIGVFVFTWLLTELITNYTAAAIMFPLPMAIAGQWGNDPMPFVMAVVFGASASFLSPFGYQTNLMVYTIGNYRVSDYIKFGLPILLVYSSIAIACYCNSSSRKVFLSILYITLHISPTAFVLYIKHLKQLITK